MATDVVMPRLSDSMEEGTVLKWLVRQGEAVERGTPLVEIETDKANMTYESDVSGTLVEVLAQEGETLAVGEPIARVGEPGEVQGRGEPGGEQGEAAEPANGEQRGAAQAAEPAKGDERAAPQAPEPEEDEAGATRAEAGAEAQEPRPVARANGRERVKASPLARRLARELGVELARLEGSGPGGRVVRADVEAAGRADVEAGPAGVEAAGQADVEAKPADVERTPGRAAAAPAAAKEAARDERAGAPPVEGVKGETRVEELTRVQRTISRRMAESRATVPDFTLDVEVDMTLCVELRARLREQSEAPPSYNDMVVKAAALALRDHPRVNGAYVDGRFELYSRVNVGVAVAAQDALVVPVVHDADQKSLGEIARRTRALAQRVRDGEVTPPELAGATFTVSNLGMHGIDRFTAVIDPPQAAILAVGALAARPAVDDRGRVVARDQLTLTLACDHRILYGADGAAFLAQVREILEQPLALAL